MGFALDRGAVSERAVFEGREGQVHSYRTLNALYGERTPSPVIQRRLLSKRESDCQLAPGVPSLQSSAEGSV